MKPVGFYLIPRMLYMVAKDILVFLGMVVVCVSMVALTPVMFLILCCKIIAWAMMKIVSFLLKYMLRLTRYLNDLFNVCYKCLNYDRERAGEY